MKKMLIFIENGFEDSEFVYPYYRFQEEGYEMDIVAPKANEVYEGEHGLTFTSNLSPKDVNLDEYDAIILPGGKAPDRIRLNKNLVSIAKDASDRGKVIAAICHGPQVLIEAGVVRGRQMTSWPSVRTDLRNAGAIVVDQEAVVDGNLVTSRSPKDLPQFCKATIRRLTKLQQTSPRVKTITP